MYNNNKVMVSEDVTVIMAIDDEPSILKVLELLFENNDDMRLITGGSGTECLELLEHVIPDVLLLDYGLPDIAGEELIDRIKHMNPKQKILLTSGYMVGDDDVLMSKVDKYLSKPMSFAELKEAVSELIS